MNCQTAVQQDCLTRRRGDAKKMRRSERVIGHKPLVGVLKWIIDVLTGLTLPSFFSRLRAFA